MIKILRKFSVITTIIIASIFQSVHANVETVSPSYLLMDSKTGQVLLAKNEHEKRPMASVTKIMTLAVIMEEIHNGNLAIDQKIKASENASKMGGSQIFLKANEEMTADTLIKSIFVASANDASVAMAEHISGSVSAFVERMNKKAADLSLVNTVFKNPHGLDEDGHYSTAHDLAVISRALISYPEVTKYTTIWQDTIRDGAFELTNTNKLVRFYDGATGLKTGSTSKAGNCISATAKRNNLELIAVSLGADTSANRFNDAKRILDYGFANYKSIPLTSTKNTVATAEIIYGCETTVDLYPKEDIDFLLKTEDKDKIDKVIMVEPKKAPINIGDVLGKISFTKNGEIISECELIATTAVEKKSYFDIINEFIKKL